MAYTGQFEYLATPFGLTGALGCFQPYMNILFKERLDEFVLVYLNDILHSKTKEEHPRHLEEVFEIIRTNKLYVKLAKHKFMEKPIQYLGHINAT